MQMARLRRKYLISKITINAVPIGATVVFLFIAYLLFTNRELARKLQDISEMNKYPPKRSLRKSIKTGFQGKCEIPHLKDLDQFFNYGNTNGKMSCTNIGELGGYARTNIAIYPYNDCSRIVCFDAIIRKKCIVLSFGIGSDDSFDSDMAEYIGCKVYMFDSTIGLDDFVNPPNKMFFNIALSDKKGNINIDGKLYKADRYESILQKLNLTNQLIDYLKVDVETSELNFFADVFSTSPQLLDNVKQIGFEVHPGLYKKNQGNLTMLEALQPFWKVMHQLECHGFDPISFIPNLYNMNIFIHNGREVSEAHDLVYVNTKFSKNIKGI